MGLYMWEFAKLNALQWSELDPSTTAIVMALVEGCESTESGNETFRRMGYRRYNYNEVVCTHSSTTRGNDAGA